MVVNSNQPQQYDAVLGGDNATPGDGLILVGIEGVKYRFEAEEDEINKASILSEAVSYGESGLDLLIYALRSPIISKFLFLEAQTLIYKYGIYLQEGCYIFYKVIPNG